MTCTTIIVKIRLAMLIQTKTWIGQAVVELFQDRRIWTNINNLTQRKLTPYSSVPQDILYTPFLTHRGWRQLHTELCLFQNFYITASTSYSQVTIFQDLLSYHYPAKAVYSIAMCPRGSQWYIGLLRPSKPRWANGSSAARYFSFSLCSSWSRKCLVIAARSCIRPYMPAPRFC